MYRQASLHRMCRRARRIDGASSCRRGGPRRHPKNTITVELGMGFKPAPTEGEDAGRSGLGLAIVSNIVTEHGGHVWVDDNEVDAAFVVGLTVPHAFDAVKTSAGQLKPLTSGW
jgi:hypothetical protein